MACHGHCMGHSLPALRWAARLRSAHTTGGTNPHPPAGVGGSGARRAARACATQTSPCLTYSLLLTWGNLHFTDNLAMAAEPIPEMLDNKSQLNLILIPLNLNLTPTLTLTLTLVHKMWKKNRKRKLKIRSFTSPNSSLRAGYWRPRALSVKCNLPLTCAWFVWKTLDYLGAGSRLYTCNNHSSNA